MGIKYILDHHVPKAIAKGLRLRGLDVVTTHEVGMARASDEQILLFARSEGYVVFTQDSDFLRLDALGLDHRGIVYSPQSRPIGELVHGLVLIYDILSPDDMLNRVEFL